MILNVTVVGDRELVLKLQKMVPAVVAALYVKTYALALKLQAHIQRNKLSGQVLNVKTGALRRSIQTRVERSAAHVTGLVYSSGDVKYAGIHEFGGRTKPHDIFPRKAKALAFAGSGGGMVFASVVHHPGSVMPMRSFMRTGLGDMQAQISRELKETVVQTMLRIKAGA